MRIALLTYEFPGTRPGGVGSYCLKCSAAFARAGHDVHLFTLTLPDDVRASVPANIHLHEVQDIAERVAAGTLDPRTGAAMLSGGPGIYKLAVGKLLCDAALSLHAQSPIDLLEAAEYEALALPLMLDPHRPFPVITQVHLSFTVNRVANHTPADDADCMIEALESAAILGADSVCAATQSVADNTRTIHRLTRDITILPHTIALHGDPTPAPTDGPVLFVGRLIPRKGVEILAPAANIFLTQHPQAALHILGADSPRPDGSSTQAWMHQHLAPHVRPRMIFKGEVSAKEIQQELRACRFALVPSLVENFANTAADAMAAGRAVIYAAHTGVAEVVADTGISVDPPNPENLAAAMSHLYTNPALARQLGAAAHHRATTQFAETEMTARRITFYQNTIDSFRAAENQHIPHSPHLTTALNTLAGHPAPNAQNSPGHRLANLLDQLQHTLGHSPKTYLFGAGRHTLRLLGERFTWESRGHAIAGIIDDHPRFTHGGTYLNLPVTNRKTFTDTHASADAIILSTDTFEAQWLDLLAPLSARGIFVTGLYNRRLPVRFNAPVISGV